MNLILATLAMAALLAQVNFNTAAQEVDIPTPVVTAGQYNGGVLVTVEPIPEAELYIFWRDGVPVSYGTANEFLDYPAWGAPPTIYAYQANVVVGQIAGELSAPAYVDLSDPCQPNGCPCNPCDPFAWCYDPFAVCE